MGLFGKKKGLVGVDIGSSAVKAVEIKVGGKGGDEFQLLNIGIESLPPEAIVDGAIMDAGAVIDSIQRLFQESRIKTAECATGVSGNAVIVKKISLPQMSPEELSESIHWEAEQYIPFDIQDVSLDYEVIEGGGSGGNMDVLLVAVKKDKISEYTSALTQAGRTPTIVDVDVFALQNCYEMNYGIDPGRVVALLNIGASIMNVNVVKGGVSVFNRDIAAGGNQYTDAIQKDLNLSFEQAEALKKGEQVEGASPGQPAPDPSGGVRERRDGDPEDVRLLPRDEPGRPYRPDLPLRGHGQDPRAARPARRPFLDLGRAAEPLPERPLQREGVQPGLSGRHRALGGDRRGSRRAKAG